MSVTNTVTTPKPPIDRLIWVYRVLFVFVLPIAIWMASKPIPQVEVPFFKHEVPAYHVILKQDIFLKRIDKSDVMANTVLKVYNLIGHYTLASLLPNKPIIESQIGPITNLHLILKTLEVAIPANMITTLGGSLRPGDIVSMAAVPLSNITSSPVIVFDKLLVLDIKTSGGQTVIILAIPADHWLYYLEKTHNATMVLARQVQ